MDWRLLGSTIAAGRSSSAGGSAVAAVRSSAASNGALVAAYGPSGAALIDGALEASVGSHHVAVLVPKAGGAVTAEVQLGVEVRLDVLLKDER